MMGSSHAASAWAAGFAAGALAQLPVGDIIILGAVTYLFCWVPDLDHPNSTATRLFPPITRPVSWVLRLVSLALYRLTRGPGDKDGAGTHRYASHTVLFAAAVGALAGSGTLTVATHLGAADPSRLAWLVGGGAALGCLVHCLGDALTPSGCPLLWPVPVRGRVWFPVRSPVPFRTGGAVERWVVFPALMVSAVLLFPGVWPLFERVAAGG